MPYFRGCKSVIGAITLILGVITVDAKPSLVMRTLPLSAQEVGHVGRPQRQSVRRSVQAKRKGPLASGFQSVAVERNEMMDDSIQNMPPGTTENPPQDSFSNDIEPSLESMPNVPSAITSSPYESAAQKAKDAEDSGHSLKIVPVTCEDILYGTQGPPADEQVAFVKLELKKACALVRTCTQAYRLCGPSDQARAGQILVKAKQKSNELLLEYALMQAVNNSDAAKEQNQESRESYESSHTSDADVG